MEPGKTEEEQLNPVLSGYFCKLVSLLISRKQRQLVPYIFAPGSDIIPFLVKHTYQRSISEILNKLLTQIDSDYDAELQSQIKEQQRVAVSQLIGLLGPDYDDETNLNACTIIGDMFETKEFFNIICHKDNLKTIVDFSTADLEAATKSSKVSSLNILNQLIFVIIDKQRKKDKNDDDSKPSFDEDDVIQQNSDDEKDSVSSDASSILVDILSEKITAIAGNLRLDFPGPTQAIQPQTKEIIPLGPQRLNTTELVLKMVQLKKDKLNKALIGS